MKEEFDQDDFEELSPTEGVLKMEMEGEVEEMPFKAKNFINKDRTIGYAEVSGEGMLDNVFLSQTEDGMVFTMPGEQFGPVGLSIEGYKTIFFLEQNTSVETGYKGHLEALGEDEPISDEAWLKKEIPDAPYRMMNVMSKVLEAAMGMMEDFVEEMGGTFEEAFSDAFDKMGATKVCGKCNTEVGEEEETCPSCGERL